jgi:hypothetical protein
MKENESGYLMAVEKGIEAWTEFLGGRLFFRILWNGKQLTFHGDRQSEKLDYRKRRLTESERGSESFPFK